MLPAASGAQVIPGSCWGNCGEHDKLSGCSCDSYCQVRGDCCANKDALCFAQLAVPLCPLVNVNTDAAVWGTDLGFSYEHKGKNEILFGDTWSTDTKPPECGGPWLDNDDSMATLPTQRPGSLPTYSTTAPVTCPTPSFVKSDADSFRALTVKVGAQNLEMGAGATPATAWSDGKTAFTWVSSGTGLSCNIWNNPCPTGTVCEDPWLTSCWPNCSQYCFDPTGPLDEFKYLVSVEVAYRPDETNPHQYVSGYTFYTNKFFYSTAVTVASFDAANPANSDYSHGYGTLLMFGRTTAYDPQGRALVYLAYQDLDSLEPVGGKINWGLQYYAGPNGSGNPTWSASVADAKPLAAAPEFHLAGFSDVTYVEPLGRWILLYAGDLYAETSTDVWTHLADTSQARKGAIHVRMADDPWGPWSPAVPLLIRETMSKYMSCESPVSPPYGTGLWTLDTDAFLSGLWSANCQTQYRNCGPTSGQTPVGNGAMYAPNILDSWTYDAKDSTYPKAAQIYFNVSTGSPYQVVLATARLELPPDSDVTFGRFIHMRLYDEQLIAANNGSATTSRQPDNTITHMQVLKASNPSSNSKLQNDSRVFLRNKNGRYLRRKGNNVVFETSSSSADAQWIVERVAGNGTVQLNDDIVRFLSATDDRRIKLKEDGLHAYDGTGPTSNFRLSWGCKGSDDCSPTR